MDKVDSMKRPQSGADCGKPEQARVMNCRPEEFMFFRIFFEKLFCNPVWILQDDHDIGLHERLRILVFILIADTL